MPEYVNLASIVFEGAIEERSRMTTTDYKALNNGDRPRRIWPLLIIALVVAIYFNSLILLKRVPLLSDIRSYYYPAWAYFSSAVKMGSIPFWCPGIYCGFPLFADSEMGLFYPLNFLLFRLPVTAGFNYSLVIHYLLGGWFTYLFCRRLRLSRSASLFAAIPFVMGGFFISHMVHPNVVATAAWMPLFLYCLERALAQRRRSFFVAAGGVVGLQFLSGFMMIPLMEMIIAFLYVLFYNKDPDETRGAFLTFGLTGLALSIVIGAGIGMVQNLPSYHLVQNSYRAGGLNEQVSNMGNLPAIQLAGLVFPRAFGRGVAMGSYAGAWTFEETYGYIGILPFLFGSIALFRPRRWHTIFFASLAIVSLFLSLGNQGLLWPILRIVPGFDILKGSSRFLLTMNLGVAVLGGIGFDRWRQGEITQKIRHSITRIWIIMAIIISGAVLALALLYHFNPLDFRDFLAAVARPFMTGIKSSPQQVLQALDKYFLAPHMEFLFPLAAIAIFLFLIRRDTRGWPGEGKILAALAIMVVDVLVFSSFIYGFVPRAKVDYQPPVVTILQDQSGDGRVSMLEEPGISRREYPLCSNQLLPYSLDDTYGFSTIPPARLDRFLALQDRLPSIEGYELLGASLLFANLARIGGLPYDLSSPLTTSSGVQVKRYVYPEIVGEQLRIIMDGTIMERESFGSIYIDLSSNGEAGINPLATLEINKESGEGNFSLNVISGYATSFIHSVSFRSAGYGKARRALEIRIPVARIRDADEIILMSICDDLEQTRFLALDAVDRRGNGLPLTTLPISYIDRDYVVFATPDPKPTAFYTWYPVYTDTWRRAVDMVRGVGGEDGKVVLLGSEIDEATRARIGGVAAPPENARISGIAEGKDNVSLHSSNEGDSILVLSIDFMPGWKAKVDGEDALIFSADGFYTALFLPGGEHDVKLVYQQPGLSIGGIISSIAIVLLAGLMVIFLRKEWAEAKMEREAAEAAAPGPDRGSISAFFPCYNDAATVRKVVEKALKTLPQLTEDFEVIIVDDGSEDQSSQIADELAARYPQVKAVHHEHNRGYGGALQTGIKTSTKKWVFYTDSDGQYDVEDLLELHPLSGRADVINGYKTGRHDPWYRIVLGSTYNFLIHRIFAIPIRDVDCDFRLMRGDLARSLNLRSEGGAICVEMIKGFQVAGANFAEVPVGHHAREVGKSQFFKPKNLVVMVGELLSLWWKVVIRREAYFAGRK